MMHAMYDCINMHLLCDEHNLQVKCVFFREIMPIFCYYATKTTFKEL